MRNLMAAAVGTIHPEFIIRLTRWAFAAAGGLGAGRGLRAGAAHKPS